MHALSRAAISLSGCERTSKPQVPQRCRGVWDAAGSLVACVGDSRGKIQVTWGRGGAVSANISPRLRSASTKAKELCPRKASRKFFTKALFILLMSCQDDLSSRTRNGLIKA
ncbi:unnamed protein product [Rangifer tarandus platyrhynchus]|uniref:Uncharacterized protein n=1 Tax=Rangifer tarandus platyrhynchus TaxID=3082113 RepID=A0AC59YFI9_RANTA